MSSHVEVLDRPAWHHETTLVLEVCDSLGQVVNDLLCKRLIPSYPLKHIDQGWLLGVVPFVNAIGFLRPDGFSCIGLPPKAACMTELLGFSQIGLTSPGRLFRNLTFRDVHDRADNLFVARLVPNGMRKIMKMLYRTIRHQQPMLPVKLMSALHCTPKNVCEKAHIVRMRSLQYQIGRWFCPGRVPVNPSRFIRPEYPLRTYFYSDAAGSTQSLRICQMRLAPPKFDFGQLPSSHIHYRTDDLDGTGFISL